MKQSGFTIIELMMVIAIAGVLATVAGPSFTSMINNNRITTQTNQFILAIQIARSEAVKRGRPVSVIATNGSDWGQGWEVIDENDVVIQNFDAIPSGLTIVSAGSKTSFTFSNGGDADSTDTLTVCKTGLNGRNINITSTGRTRLISTGISCS